MREWFRAWLCGPIVGFLAFVMYGLGARLSYVAAMLAYALIVTLAIGLKELVQALLYVADSVNVEMVFEDTGPADLEMSIEEALAVARKAATVTKAEAGKSLGEQVASRRPPLRLARDSQDLL